MQKYIVVAASSVSELETAVNEKVEQGYVANFPPTFLLLGTRGWPKDRLPAVVNCLQPMKWEPPIV